jgi:carbonic anhydrase
VAATFPDPILTPTGSSAPSTIRPSPGRALSELLAGNRRFVNGEPRYGHHLAAAVAAAGEQRPVAAVLGCIDSRVPLEAVFDQDFGAICVIRSGGLALDRAVLGSVEFAVAALQVPLVMVLGHSRCGAVEATIGAVRGGARPSGELGFLVDEIAPAVRSIRGEPTVSAVTRAHVGRTAGELGRLERVRNEADSGSLTVVGAVYDLDSGQVEVLT